MQHWKPAKVTVKFSAEMAASKTAKRPAKKSRVSSDDESSPSSSSSPSRKTTNKSNDRRHVLPAELEVASEDEDFSADDDEATNGFTDKTDKHDDVVTTAQIRHYISGLRGKPSVVLFRNLIDVFVRLSGQVSDDDDKASNNAHGLFNHLLKACVRDFPAKLRQLTKLDNQTTLAKDENKKTSSKISRSKSGDILASSEVKFLRLQSTEWRQLRVKLRGYLLVIVQILDAVSLNGSHSDVVRRHELKQQRSMQRLILRHIVALMPFYLASEKCTKSLLQTLIRVWSEATDDDVRVLLFLTIMRVLRYSYSSDNAARNSAKEAASPSSSGNQLLLFTIKKMYTAFLESAKATSVESLPAINFMQHSLAEVLSINPDAVYEHAFTSIRQLASTLRIAIISKSQPTTTVTTKGKSRKQIQKPDRTNSAKASNKRLRGDKAAQQSGQNVRIASMDRRAAVKRVYSWPFVHATTMWARFLARQHSHAVLSQLVHPLSQTLQGAIALESSARNLPIRSHFVRALTMLVAGSNGQLHIPVLSNAVLSPLHAPWCQTLLNKSASINSLKAQNWRVMLKLSESQLKEDATRAALIDAISDSCMEYFGVTCHRLSFPESVQMPLAQMRLFLKSPAARRSTEMAQYVRLLKRRVEENCDFMLKLRQQQFLQGSKSAVAAIVNGGSLSEPALELENRMLNASKADKNGSDEKVSTILPPFIKYFKDWKEKRYDELVKQDVESGAATSSRQRRKVGTKKSRTGEESVPSYADMAALQAKAKNDFMADLVEDDDEDDDKVLLTRKRIKTSR